MLYCHFMSNVTDTNNYFFLIGKFGLDSETLLGSLILFKIVLYVKKNDEVSKEILGRETR